MLPCLSFLLLTMNKKYISLGIAIGVIGLILSHSYRPYIYTNHIQDFHIADTIGSIVCVPAAVLFFYGFNNKHSIKEYTIYAALTYISYELLGVFNIHGTFDWYDIIAIVISSILFYSIYRLLEKR